MSAVRKIGRMFALLLLHAENSTVCIRAAVKGERKKLGNGRNFHIGWAKYNNRYPLILELIDCLQNTGDSS